MIQPYIVNNYFNTVDRVSKMIKYKMYGTVHKLMPDTLSNEIWNRIDMDIWESLQSTFILGVHAESHEIVLRKQGITKR